MRVTRVSPVSVAKVFCVVNAVIGLIIGAIIACVSLLGATFRPSHDDGFPALFGVLFGVGAVIFMPLIYGFFGALGGLIWSVVYNVAAGFVGGIELTVEPLTLSR